MPPQSQVKSHNLFNNQHATFKIKDIVKVYDNNLQISMI